ncbi:MAG: hydrolase [Pseudomonadota bacterium]|nr:hydrolase [Pseudomonadota bacterium]
MRLQDANQLLDANPHPFEEGCKLLPDGVGVVAARTEMPGCKGAMIDWWFSHIHTTEQYKEWHPADHVWSDWKGPRDKGVYIGGTHLIHERLGSERVHKLKLNFRDPSAILDVSRFRAAGVSTAVYGRGGPLHLPLWTAHVLHLVHDTAEGCVMRSRFWFGDVSPAIPLLAGMIRRDMTSAQAMQGLLTHCKIEMNRLASFLPEKYRQATRGSAA